MRIDVFLKKVCLLKSRTMAREACDRGKVRLNGASTRASRDVLPDDVIAMDFPTGTLEIIVTALPAGNVSRVEAPGYYRIVKDERGSRPGL